VAAAEEREEAMQVKPRADHETGVTSDLSRDQQLVRRIGFWRKIAFTSLRAAPEARDSIPHVA
jgi:hypothetical protein